MYLLLDRFGTVFIHFPLNVMLSVSLCINDCIVCLSMSLSMNGCIYSATFCVCLLWGPSRPLNVMMIISHSVRVCVIFHIHVCYASQPSSPNAILLCHGGSAITRIYVCCARSPSSPNAALLRDFASVIVYLYYFALSGVMLVCYIGIIVFFFFFKWY